MLPSVWDTCQWVLKYSVTDCRILGSRGFGIYDDDCRMDDAFVCQTWRSPLTRGNDNCARAAPQSFGNSDSRKLFLSILLLFTNLYQHAIEYREGIIQALVHHCFSSASKRFINEIMIECSGPVNQNGNKLFEKHEHMVRYKRDIIDKYSKCTYSGGSHEQGFDFLPSIKDCLSTSAKVSSETGLESVMHQHGIAHVSMNILEHLLTLYPETHVVLMTTLMDKIQAKPSSMSHHDAAGSGGSLRRVMKAYSTTLLVLPSPLILHRYVNMPH